MPKGKKICPECGIENGVRTSTCGCGHRFLFKEKTLDKKETIKEASPATPVASEDRRPFARTAHFSVSRPLVQTPAGRCPIKPLGFLKDWPNGPASEDVIEDWAVKVFSSGNYLPDAVLYWIHEFWDMNLDQGKEYRRVRSIVLKTLCGNGQEAL